MSDSRSRYLSQRSSRASVNASAGTSYNKAASLNTAHNAKVTADLLGLQPQMSSSLHGYNSLSRLDNSRTGQQATGYPEYIANSNGSDLAQQGRLGSSLTRANGSNDSFSFNTAIFDTATRIEHSFSIPRQSELPQLQDPPYPDFASLTTQPSFSQQNSLGSQNQALSKQKQSLQGREATDSGYGTLQDGQSRSGPSLGLVNHRSNLNTPQRGTASNYEPSVSGSMSSNLHTPGDDRVPPTSQPSSSSAPFVQRHCPAPGCGELITTPSQLKKHQNRHGGVHLCQVRGCTRSEQGHGFGTVNDRDRHHSSVHKDKGFSAERYSRCFADGCSRGGKIWDRIDNFKTHVEKIHAGIRSKEEKDDPEKRAIADALILRSLEWWNLQKQQGQAPTSVNPEMLHPHDDSIQLTDSPATHHSSDSSLPVRRTQITGITSRAEMDTWRRTLFPRQPVQGLQQQQPYVSQGNIHHQAPPHRYHPYGNSQRLTTNMPPPSSSTLAVPIDFQPLAARQTQSRPRQVPIPRRQRLSDLFDDEEHADYFSPGSNSDFHSFHMTEILFDSAPLASNQGPKGAKTAPNPGSARISEVDAMLPLSSEMHKESTADNILANMGYAPHLTDSGAAVRANDPPYPNPASISLSPGQELMDKRLLTLIDSIPALLSRFQNGSDSTSLTPTQISERLKSELLSLPPTSVSADAIKKNPKEAQQVKDSEGKTRYKCTWDGCNKTKDRHSDFTKHLRRHTRPYGCTFVLECSGRFGSKNDLKRHEHTQHEQLECWRCETCRKLFFKRDHFHSHLKESHREPEANARELLRDCRISRKHQGYYWCGFCEKIKKMKAKGIPGDNERFTHICNHFIKDNKSIDDWLAPKGDKTKGELDKEKAEKGSETTDHGKRPSPGSDTDSESDEEGSPEPKSNEGDSEEDDLSLNYAPQVPQGGSSGRAPRQQQFLELPSQSNLTRKRTRSNDEDLSPSASGSTHRERRPTKKTKKMQAQFAICCQCRQQDMMLNKETLLAVSKICVDCDHVFCRNCKYIRNVETAEDDDYEQ